MSSEWQYLSLRDCITHKKGFAFKSSDYTDYGTPIVKVTNTTNNSIDMANVVYISNELAEKNKSVKLLKNDIVIATVGSWPTNPASVVGKTIKVPIEADGALLNQNAVRIRPLSDEIEKLFLYYLLKNKSFSDYLIGNAQGSANQASITLEDIYSYETNIPPLPIQKKIAHILSTLDDKIELNRKMNQTLEVMAQAIFKSWFVDFAPVHAKAKCANDADLEAVAKELGISKEILNLFPSEFEESELGMIPKGWEVKTIKDFGRVVTGKTPPSKIEDAYNDDGKPFITPTDIDDSLFLVTTNRHLSANGEIAIKNTIIPADSICVTCIGSQMGKTIISPYDACTNQQINSIIVSSNNLRNYLFCNLRNRKNEIFLMGSGGSTMPLLNKSTFEKMKVLLPQQDILNKFDILVKDKLLLVLKNDLENITLAKIRNNLLSKLLSGEIDVTDLSLEME